MLPCQEHWFAIRKVEGDWWNFNSLYPAPEFLSAFYLTAYLDSLKEQGYTIFVIRGPLPASPASTGTLDMDGPGKWWSADEVRRDLGQALLGVDPCRRRHWVIFKDVGSQCSVYCSHDGITQADACLRGCHLLCSAALLTKLRRLPGSWGVRARVWRTHWRVQQQQAARSHCDPATSARQPAN